MTDPPSFRAVVVILTIVTTAGWIVAYEQPDCAGAMSCTGPNGEINTVTVPEFLWVLSLAPVTTVILADLWAAIRDVREKHNENRDV
jgi:hypothetical protein